MTIANDIINDRMPDFDFYLRSGESLDDIDEYGFTPLIQAAITRQEHIAGALITRGVNVNKTDVTGRTALHWAVDNGDMALCTLLLQHGADPNAYTRAGLSTLVYPVLREQNALKHLLYKHGGKLDFALDFIYAKLLGHRFELQGTVDIVNAKNEFIELDYEGFILEFTVAVIQDSLRRFTSSYSTRHLREKFPALHLVMDAFAVADELLQFQQIEVLSQAHLQRIAELIQSPLLFLPAASSGHALGFVRYRDWWAKIDRGENSQIEGSVNIYRMTRPEALTVSFIKEFLFVSQPREYYHRTINQHLGLVHETQLQIPTQIVGNCSWANVQAAIPAAYFLLTGNVGSTWHHDESIALYNEWIEWDKDRALDESIQRFYVADMTRRASFAAMLAGVLFQACDYSDSHHVARAEKILTILTIPEYYYVLQSYLDEYCVKRLTLRGNNLLKLLEDCGVNSNIDVNPIATDL